MRHRGFEASGSPPSVAPGAAIQYPELDGEADCAERGNAMKQPKLNLKLAMAAAEGRAEACRVLLERFSLSLTHCVS